MLLVALHKFVKTKSKDVLLKAETNMYLIRSYTYLLGYTGTVFKYPESNWIYNEPIFCINCCILILTD